MSAVLGRLGQLQIDSVNVFERAHYVPLYSRLGPISRAAVDHWAERETIEYWPHQAGLIASADWPLWQFRREEYGRGRHGAWLSENVATVAWVRSELAGRGPLTSRQLEQARPPRRGSWWGWSDAKRALELLWRTGEVVVRRRVRFERVYESAESVPLAPSEPGRGIPDELFDRAAAALGVFTLADLADYWRVSLALTRLAVHRLVEAGRLEPVQIPEWSATARSSTPQSAAAMQAYRHVTGQLPARISSDALLSPFDPLVWFRARSERVFDFHYRIEIYTPEAQRRYGYYCLPVLLGDQVCGRLDLKADRSQRTLLVKAAWADAHAPADAAERTRNLIDQAARWQGLEQVVVEPRGNLAHTLTGGWLTGSV